MCIQRSSNAMTGGVVRGWGGNVEKECVDGFDECRGLPPFAQRTREGWGTGSGRIESAFPRGLKHTFESQKYRKFYEDWFNTADFG